MKLEGGGFVTELDRDGYLFTLFYLALTLGCAITKNGFADQKRKDKSFAMVLPKLKLKKFNEADMGRKLGVRPRIKLIIFKKKFTLTNF